MNNQNNPYPWYNQPYNYQYPETNPLYPPQQFNNYDNSVALKDYGKDPFVINIEDATKQNNNFRLSLWTGKYLQVTLMSIEVGEDIGLEVHNDHDQFLRIEHGQGLVKMGSAKNNLSYSQNVYEDDVIIIPAGKWHNLINTGNTPLKLYSIYAPPEHPFGTIHKTKSSALTTEGYNYFR